MRKNIEIEAKLLWNYSQDDSARNAERKHLDLSRTHSFRISSAEVKKQWADEHELRFNNIVESREVLHAEYIRLAEPSLHRGREDDFEEIQSYAKSHKLPDCVLAQASIWRHKMHFSGMSNCKLFGVYKDELTSNKADDFYRYVLSKYNWFEERDFFVNGSLARGWDDTNGLEIELQKMIDFKYKMI